MKTMRSLKKKGDKKPTDKKPAPGDKKEDPKQQTEPLGERIDKNKQPLQPEDIKMTNPNTANTSPNRPPAYSSKVQGKVNLEFDEDVHMPNVD